MSDFIQFNEGAAYIAAHGWPPTVWFMLSENPVSLFSITNTLASGLGEISGTGYTRIPIALPTMVGGVLAFPQMTWATDVNTDWPNTVCSIIAATTSNSTGSALCAWNLQPGGTPRDMAHQHVFEEVTPTYIT